MIKIFAAAIMLIDHIGMILFPDVYVLRIIGRLSMPLFAYSIARGFYYSEQKGSTIQYSKRLLLFSIVSQIPYTVLSYWCIGEFNLNIGFTWLLSLILMKSLNSDVRSAKLFCLSTLVFLIALFVPIDYGLYGVLMPSVFYSFMFKRNKPEHAFLGTTLLFALDAVLRLDLIQAFSLISFPLLLVLKKYDAILRLPRHTFYWFYPAHVTILLLLKLFTRV